MILTVRPLIHDVDPYVDLDWDTHRVDLQGWHSHSKIFNTLIEQKRPRLVCEVGTWKGASAVYMADLMLAFGCPGEIVCVDTWLGALEFWERPDQKEMLRLRHGYPSVYETFVRNVASLGFAPYITPFPTTSAIAARFFRAHNVMFDMTYIDGSHDTSDVITDIMSYHSISEFIFGDDYDWPSVRTAVDTCAASLGKLIRLFENKWWFE